VAQAEQADHLAIIKAVREASELGISVVPVAEDGSKRPALTSWSVYQERVPKTIELNEWFKDRPRTGCGWITGAVSGIECLDFDSQDAFETYADLAQEMISSTWERLCAYVESTPNGRHLFWRCTGIESNQKLAHDKDGKAVIETRGEGGFVVVAPSYGSVHPSSEPYTAVGTPADIPAFTSDERNAVLSLARSMDQRPRAADERPKVQHAPAGTGDRPGDVYVQRTEWSEVLEPHGWRLVKRHAGESYWRRPGASTEGIDSTTNFKGSDLLYVFSTNAAPFETERGYNRFSAYSLLEHGGDYSKAAAELARQGFTSDVQEASPEPPDPVPEPVPEPAPEPVVTGRRTSDYKFDHGWDAEGFIGRYIRYASSLTDAPHEYHESAALSILATASPNVRTYLDPWPDGLSTNLYMLLVGGTTSSRKSTSLSLARRLLSAVSVDAVLAERMTPEAMVEQLSARPRSGSLLIGDEFGEALDMILRQGYMSGLRELFLALYGSRRYKYARRSKRIAGGGQQSDIDEIIDPHLTILTASTGSIFEVLSSRDIQTGLVPRFSIIYPRRQPPRRSIYERAENSSEDERWLKRYLQAIYLWAHAAGESEREIRVEWTEGALFMLDWVSEKIEASPSEITSRLGPAAIKVAMLASMSETPPSSDTITVVERHADQAARVIERWKVDALRFEDEIGGLSAYQRRTEQAIERTRKLLAASGGSLARSVVSRSLKLEARELDRLEETMVDRSVIEVVQQEREGSGRRAKLWRLL
jgi:hypothetical protein